MPLSADLMRIILVICLLGMSLLAVLYLHSRKMSYEAYLGWGIFAILLPILGPILVIIFAPGPAAKSDRLTNSRRRSIRKPFKPNLPG